MVAPTVLPFCSFRVSRRSARTIAIGPVLGGWITDNYNCRGVFLINIPIGILSLFLADRFLHDPPSFAEERKSVRVDSKLRVEGIGIALITTVSERRQSFHQSAVSANIASSSPALQQGIRNTTAYLQTNGYSHVNAVRAAYLRYYDQFQAQTRLLAFMDCFFIIGIVPLVAAPLVLLTKDFQVGKKPPPAH